MPGLGFSSEDGCGSRYPHSNLAPSKGGAPEALLVGRFCFQRWRQRSSFTLRGRHARVQEGCNFRCCETEMRHIGSRVYCICCCRRRWRDSGSLCVERLRAPWKFWCPRRGGPAADSNGFAASRRGRTVAGTLGEQRLGRHPWLADYDAGGPVCDQRPLRIRIPRRGCWARACDITRSASTPDWQRAGPRRSIGLGSCVISGQHVAPRWFLPVQA